MARPQRRRPYRVVFTRPGERRSGTVVTADEATAHQEARVIARDGAVAGQGAVHVGGHGVARVTGVDQVHQASGPAQHQRRAHPGRAAPDHDDVAALLITAVAAADLGAGRGGCGDHGTWAEAMKMGMSTVTSTEVDVMFQAVPR